jgi:hypothetical protein
MKTIFLFCIAIVLINTWGCKDSNEYRLVYLELKSNWEFKQSSDNHWKKAFVPGDILFNVVKGQYGYVENDAIINSGFQWIGKSSWEYRTSFDVDKKFLSFENIEILCDNIKGSARVYLNDSLLFLNSGGSLQVPCKSFLKLKGNQLRITFNAPAKPSDGIWKPFKLRAWCNARIVNTNFYLTSLSDDLAQYNAEITLMSSSDKVVNIDILVNQKHVVTLSDLLLKKGINKQWISLNIHNPKLWWTNGLGLPYIYNISVILKSNGLILHEYKQRIGVCKIERSGKNLSLKSGICYTLNDVPLYIKGVYYLPPVCNLSDSTLDDYRKIVETAQKTNVNFISVASADFFGSEVFASLCEENGILFFNDSVDCFSTSAKMDSHNNKTIEKILFSPIRFGFLSPPSIEFLTQKSDSFNRWNDGIMYSKCLKNSRYTCFRKSYMDSIKKLYNPPFDLKDLIYYSQILQSDQIKSTIENARIKNSSCGLLYHQFNESCYSLSESTLNNYSNWKPANYVMRDAFLSCTVVPVNNQDKVDVYIINDELKEIDGILLCKLIDFYGNDYYVKQIPVSIKANSVCKAVEVNKKDLFAGTSENKTCFFVQLNRPGQTVAQNILYFTIPKNLSLPSINLNPVINVVARKYNLIFRSDVLVKNIVLNTKYQNAVFSDNNFDLLPGKRTKISVLYKGTSLQLQKELYIKYLNPGSNIPK